MCANFRKPILLLGWYTWSRHPSGWSSPGGLTASHWLRHRGGACHQCSQWLWAGRRLQRIGWELWRPGCHERVAVHTVVRGEEVPRVPAGVASWRGGTETSCVDLQHQPGQQGNQCEGDPEEFSSSTGGGGGGRAWAPAVPPRPCPEEGSCCYAPHAVPLVWQVGSSE